MKRAIALVFTAAALLMWGAVAVGIYNRKVIDAQRAAAGEPHRFTMDCYHCGGMEPWEQTASVAGLVAVAMSIAGVMLCGPEPQPPHRVSMLGLDTGAPRRVGRADAARLPCPHDDEGLTPLERVIRAS